MERFIEIDGWKSHITFSACHMLLRHDKCSRLHGHTYAVHLRLKGVPDRDMLLTDFGLLKKALREIAEELDHRALVPGKNADVRISDVGNDGNITIDMAGKVYSIPRDDVRVLPLQATTVEELSRYFLDILMSRLELPGDISEISIGVDEGQGQGAWAVMRLG
jgi:6-pyruvoyltetrahydropterin/6-carboxytetrahydropterin synthase